MCSEGPPTVRYSDVRGDEIWQGEGNINQDPRFVAGPLGAYYLSQVSSGQNVNSPCLDAGDPATAPWGWESLTTRTDEQPDAGVVDMGYHYYPLPCTDEDGDTYAVEGGLCGEIDCDDTEPAINPGADEVCNGIDDNCDGNTDDVDEDGDGYLSDECIGGFDCNDDPSDDPAMCADCSCGSAECAPCARCRHPGATDFCGDGVDSDCDGETPYPCPANAIASTYGRESLVGSGVFNKLTLLFFPVFAVILLRSLSRKR